MLHGFPLQLRNSFSTLYIINKVFSSFMEQFHFKTNRFYSWPLYQSANVGETLIIWNMTIWRVHYFQCWTITMMTARRWHIPTTMTAFWTITLRETNSPDHHGGTAPYHVFLGLIVVRNLHPYIHLFHLNTKVHYIFYDHIFADKPIPAFSSL